jgi:hypothetical protein
MECFEFFVEICTFREKMCGLQIGAYLLHAIPMASAALLTYLIISQYWMLVENANCLTPLLTYGQVSSIQ